MSELRTEIRGEFKVELETKASKIQELEVLNSTVNLQNVQLVSDNNELKKDKEDELPE